MSVPPSCTLRPYQQRLVDKAVAMFLGHSRNGAGELEAAARSVMIESPTGSGKTVIGLHIAKAIQDLTGAKVGWVAMRRNLLEQALHENHRHGIGVEMTAISLFEKSPPSDIEFLVADESQHDASNSAAHIHNVVQPRWILGLTATPFRTDRVRLCFDRVVKDAGIHQLIQDGYLSAFDHYTLPRWSVETVADAYLAERQRWGKSIFFFHTVDDCQRLAGRLAAAGITAEVVTGSSDRDSQLAAFRSGRIPVLINCMVLTEGFDDPTLQTAWVRPSAKGPTVQMAGRALRKHDGVLKQIVQCRDTLHPFVKTATPRQQFVWHPEGWRSLSINPLLERCSQNARLLIAQTVVALPPYLERKAATHSRRWRASPPDANG
ncbi:MAG: DEAD/DEAH box helicase [Planctomycetota bacterium]